MRISASQAKLLGIKTSKSKPRKSTKSRMKRSYYNSNVVKFEIILPFDPQPKERPRTVIDKKSIISAFHAAKGNPAKFEQLISNKTSRTYTPKNTVDYEGIIKANAMSEMSKNRIKPFDCPVKTHTHFVFKGDENDWPTSHSDGDADNLEKAILDALNKVVYTDDRLVVKSTRSKSCGPNPKVIIKVSAMNSVSKENLVKRS